MFILFLLILYCVYVFIIARSIFCSVSSSSSSFSSYHTDTSGDEHCLEDFHTLQDASEYDDQIETTTCIEEDMEISLQSFGTSIHAPIVSNLTAFKTSLKSELQKFNDQDSLMHQDPACDTRQPKTVVSVEKLQVLKGFICLELLGPGTSCSQDRTFNYTARGSVLELTWTCSNGHKGMWKSSEIVTKSHNTDIYLHDVLIPACVFISGNSYTKICSILETFLV